MMKLYIRICVDLRRNVYAKDGLHQYRSISQQHQPESLQTVVQYFLDLAEQRCEDALSRSNFKLEASDDLDDIASAETLMLTSVTTEGDRERVERETLVPWLRFLHDAYRTVLDIVRNNNKLEHVYHNTCGRAYDFCIKYERKQEFRRICEFIRRHLVSIEKWSTQENPKRPSYQIVLNADVYEKHLKTKFRQLKAAVDLQMLREAYKTIEEIHRVIGIINRPVQKEMMAEYYRRLTDVSTARPHHHPFPHYSPLSGTCVFANTAQLSL